MWKYNYADVSVDVSHNFFDVIEHRMQDNLSNIMKWKDSNKLTMNLKKTKCTQSCQLQNNKQSVH